MIISFQQRHSDLMLTTLQTMLEGWHATLKTSPSLELGDEPDLIEALCVDLERSTRLVASTRYQFSIKRVPLKVANRFNRVVSSLHHFYCLADAIRASDAGSRENTLRCLDYLRQCQELLDEFKECVEQPSRVERRFALAE